MEITDRGLARIVADETLVPAAVAEQGCTITRMIADLEGTIPTRKQLLAASAITASARAYDDIYDACPVNQGMVKGGQMKETLSGKTSSLVLPQGLNSGVKIITDNLEEAARSAMLALASAQSESIQQRLPEISDSMLETITRKKGANTALLFALNVNPNLSLERRECFEELGYLMQLVDDYIDQNQDKTNGIVTLINREIDPHAQSIRIVQQAQKVKQLFSLNYEPLKVLNIFRYIDGLVASCGIR